MTKNTPKPTPSCSIAVVRYPHAQSSAVYGLIEFFEVANRIYARKHGHVFIHAEVIDASALPKPDTLWNVVILPPSMHTNPPENIAQELSTWLHTQASHGTLLSSVCVGTFLLAMTGLLDGKMVTTHWALEKIFQERFPRVSVQVDHIVIDAGDVVTAGGLMAWVDLALALITRFLGPSYALETAQFFLVDLRGREQRFYRTFAPSMTHGDQPILRVQRWMVSALSGELSVDDMAHHARLHKRTFHRRFVRATGHTPNVYLQKLRVEKARTFLERTGMNQNEVSWGVGYEDPSSFRNVFQKHMGLTPSAYRARFGDGAWDL